MSQRFTFIGYNAQFDDRVDPGGHITGWDAGIDWLEIKDSLGAITSDCTGDNGIVGGASMFMPGLTVSLNGSPSGEALSWITADMAPLTMTGVARNTLIGEIDVSIPAFTAEIAGTFLPILIGDLIFSTPTIDAVINGTQVNNVLDMTLTAIDAACHTGVIMEGSLPTLKVELSQKGMTFSLPIMTMEAQSMFGEDMELNLPSLQMAATGTPYGASLNVTVPKMKVEMYVGDSVVAKLPKLGVALTGSAGIVAGVSANLGKMKCTSYAGANLPVKLSKITLTMGGTVKVDARLSGRLGLMKCAMHAIVSREGDIAARIPPLGASFVGAVYPVGNVKGAFPALGVVLSGSSGKVARLNGRLPELTLLGRGGSTINNLAAELPSFEALVNPPPEACTEYDTLRYGGM